MFSRLRQKFKISKKSIVTVTLLIVVFVMSLGYAALSQFMEIEGMAIIDKRWDVEITNVTIASTNSGSGVKSFDTGATVVSLNTTLPSLTSTVTYTITLKNSGNMEGKLYSVDKIEDDNTNITYTISGVTAGTTTIAAGATATVTVKVQYKSGATVVSSEAKKIMIGFNFIEEVQTIPTYTISVNVYNNTGGTVTPASQTVESGGTATFTLTPAANYVYTTNIYCTGATVSGNTMTFTNVTSDLTCSVVFTQPTTTTYVWERYSIAWTYALGSPGSTSQTSGCLSVCSSYSFDSTTGSLGVSGCSYQCCGSSWTSGTRYNSSGSTLNIYQCTSSTGYITVTPRTVTLSGQTKGSYIDEVTSTSSSTYPTNGVMNGYWYVYKGTQ